MAGSLVFKSTLTDTDPFSSVEPTTKTVTVSYTAKSEKVFTLTDTEPVVAWDPLSSTSAVQDFDGLYVLSDGSVDMELGVDVAGVGTDAAQFWVERIAANAPKFLASDDSFGLHITGGALGQTAKVINKIRFVNPNASTTVNVVLKLVT